MTQDDLRRLEEEALATLAQAGDAAALEGWRVRYLGRKGRLTAALRAVGALAASERPAAGEAANRAKGRLEAALKARREALARPSTGSAAAGRGGEGAAAIDVTLPARPLPRGHLHPVTLMRRRVERIFRAMGFAVVEGPEVEWEHYNFERLRIPKDHPARDMWDTLWIDYERAGERPMLLRTHTSPMQVRYLERQAPPIRIIVPGTCYRYEATDATHEWMLTQVEGLAVDEGITLGQLKGTLESFVRQLFGAEVETRFRCDYFPFVEPGAELAIRRPGGDWLEVLGAGMVHPEIIEEAGLDASRYTGFAFGLGVERLAMLEWGIADIREFYRNDVRFLDLF